MSGTIVVLAIDIQGNNLGRHGWKALRGMELNRSSQRRRSRYMSAMTYQCYQLRCGWSALGGKREVEGSILRLTSPRQAAY